MPLKTDTVEEPALNLTPMIDIVFLLVIFFMVGAQITDQENEDRVDVKLPTVADVEPLSRRPDALVVTVQRDGTITVDDAPKSLAELESLLVEAHGNYADQAVLVRGDREGRYQNVMDVLAACNRADIRHISLANQRSRTEADR